MARMPDLEIFAKEHNLAIATIADLIEYRLQKDRLVELVGATEMELSGASGKAVFKAYIYRAVPGVKRREYVALTLGDIADGRPVPCRGHVASLADDVFGGRTRKNSPPLDAVIDAIIRKGRGVILYLPSRETIEAQLITPVLSAKRGPRDREGEIREYGIGVQILLDLGVERLQVISNNPHRLVGLEAWGFKSTEQITLEEI
jgi:3,4-dihydroxy 2-butanone 4-phosphate synthase/GTP cyclohydrolase II